MSKLLWEPSEERIKNTNMYQFIQYVNERYKRKLYDYPDLYQWSTSEMPLFWEAIWDYGKVILSQPYHQVIDYFKRMPGARWFAGSKLNFAENLLRYRDDRQFVRLEDHDPCDYASVMRVFPQHRLAHLSFQVRARQKATTSAPLEIDVVSSNGTRAVAIPLNGGKITAWNGTTEEEDVRKYPANERISLELLVDGGRQVYTLRVESVGVVKKASFREPTPAVGARSSARANFACASSLAAAYGAVPDHAPSKF